MRRGGTKRVPLQRARVDRSERLVKEFIANEAGGGGGGDVTGPGSSTDHEIVRFSGTGGKVIQDGTSTVLLDSGEIGINTVTVPRAGVGASSTKLALHGVDGAPNGPHVQVTTDADDYPIIQHFHAGHDSVGLAFDAYFDGAGFRSSDAGSNFAIYKNVDMLRFLHDDSNAQGVAVTLTSALDILATGELDVGVSLRFQGDTDDLYIREKLANVDPTGTWDFSLATVTGLGIGQGHEIRNDGGPLTDRTGLHFTDAFITVSDDVGNDETDVTLNEAMAPTWTGLHKHDDPGAHIDIGTLYTNYTRISGDQGQFQRRGAASGNLIIRGKVASDAQERYQLNCGGTQNWSDGVLVSPDVTLGRTAAGTLGLSLGDLAISEKIIHTEDSVLQFESAADTGTVAGFCFKTTVNQPTYNTQWKIHDDTILMTLRHTGVLQPGTGASGEFIYEGLTTVDPTGAWNPSGDWTPSTGTWDLSSATAFIPPLDSINPLTHGAHVGSKGQIISYNVSNVPTMLSVGANDLVLTADSAATVGFQWKTAAAGGTGDELLNWMGL